MSDEKESGGFFRKVVKFVANPTTDWADLEKREDAKQSEFLKSELKAIVERKRRNDFVRKREFDMLRKLRREGITEGASTLARMSSLALDADDSRLDRNDSDIVKQKIDEIEQQMSGEVGARRTSTPDPGHLQRAQAPTQPMPLPAADEQPTAPGSLGPASALPRYLQPTEPMPLDASPRGEPARAERGPAPGAILSQVAEDGGTIEVSEVAHDPELDEAVISFANADFGACEAALTRLIQPEGPRANVADTWMVLFDLYRAIGKQAKFEALAVEYANHFNLSPPQWFSLPQLVAEAAVRDVPEAASAQVGDAAGGASGGAWSSPERLDLQTVSELQSTLLQLPLPWALDWSALRTVEPEAAHALRDLMRSWSTETVTMQWSGVESLFDTLEELTPTSDRNTDPAFWLLRLEMLRLINQAMRYDEVALDYCITYEVSPPAWEAANCSVEVDLRPSPSRSSSSWNRLSRIGDVSTRYVESELDDEEHEPHEEASLTLSGQLVGDIGPVLKQLEEQLSSASVVRINCGTLIRVDFIAAGDLLNWVLARREENRNLAFLEANRLVALFFGAMGITEYARVGVRHV